MIRYLVINVDELEEGDIVKIVPRHGVRRYTWEFVCPYAEVTDVPGNDLDVVTVTGFTYRNLGYDGFIGPVHTLENHYPIMHSDYKIELLMLTPEERERLEEEGHRLFV